MKAILLTETGGPEKVTYADIEQPKASPEEVVIQLKAASLNRRDVFVTYGLYPGMKLPAVLGSDGAGTIYEAGKEAGDFIKGEEVVINPGIAWGPDNRFNGPEFRVLGMPENGTYAQYVKVPAENVYRKPAYLSWMEAAALPLSALTAYRALITRGNIKAGETIFIPGIGSGVALFALQIAAAKGARVFVSSSSDEKLARAKKMGAAGGINYLEGNWAKKLKADMGEANVIIDGVGGNTFQDLVFLTKPGGKIVTFGATAGPVPNLVMPRVFFKHLDVLGTTMGSPAEFAAMLSFFQHHQIRPVIDQAFPLSQAANALKQMDKGNSFGKIILTID